MPSDNISIYYEICDKTTMLNYPFFLEKLKQIQKLTYKKSNDVANNHIVNKDTRLCQKCLFTKIYKLGNIVWQNNIVHKIKKHKKYPSEYFIYVIINTCIVNNAIVNPPLKIVSDKINSFGYIPLHYNKLLIIDALMKQGSQKRYLFPKDENSAQNRFIYSEHSGVLSLKDKRIDNIIVSTDTNRVDDSDKNIYLPVNNDLLAKHSYLFHTHPNSSTYAGRIKEGIIYEFPSANDVFNFVKYHNDGLAQSSIIVAPEGIYVIRSISYINKYNINISVFYDLQKFILELEKNAVKEIKPIINSLSDPDIFHQTVGSNMKYIKLYNKYIKPYNLYIEYYPRQKKNNEWCLRQINLQYLDI